MSSRRTAPVGRAGWSSPRGDQDDRDHGQPMAGSSSSPCQALDWSTKLDRAQTHSQTIVNYLDQLQIEPAPSPPPAVGELASRLALLQQQQQAAKTATKTSRPTTVAEHDQRQQTAGIGDSKLPRPTAAITTPRSTRKSITLAKTDPKPSRASEAARLPSPSLQRTAQIAENPGAGTGNRRPAQQVSFENKLASAKTPPLPSFGAVLTRQVSTREGRPLGGSTESQFNQDTTNSAHSKSDASASPSERSTTASSLGSSGLRRATTRDRVSYSNISNLFPGQPMSLHGSRRRAQPPAELSPVTTVQQRGPRTLHRSLNTLARSPAGAGRASVSRPSSAMAGNLRRSTPVGSGQVPLGRSGTLYYGASPGGGGGITYVERQTILDPDCPLHGRNSPGARRGRTAHLSQSARSLQQPESTQLWRDEPQQTEVQGGWRTRPHDQSYDPDRYISRADQAYAEDHHQTVVRQHSRASDWLQLDDNDNDQDFNNDHDDHHQQEYDFDDLGPNNGRDARSRQGYRYASSAGLYSPTNVGPVDGRSRAAYIDADGDDEGVPDMGPGSPPTATAYYDNSRRFGTLHQATSFARTGGLEQGSRVRSRLAPADEQLRRVLGQPVAFRGPRPVHLHPQWAYSRPFLHLTGSNQLGITGGDRQADDRPQYAQFNTLKDAQAIRAVDFHPSGQVYAVGSNSRALRICAYPAAHELAEFEADRTPIPPRVLFKFLQLHRGSIYCVRFNGSGQLLATGSNDQTVHLVRYNSQSHTPDGDEFRLSMHDGTVRDLCFVDDSTSSSSAATGGLSGEQASGGGVAGSGALLLSAGGGDNKIYVTDCETVTPFQSMAGHSQMVMALARWPGASFVSASLDRTIRFWDLRSRTCTSIVSAPPLVEQSNTGSSTQVNKTTSHLAGAGPGAPVCSVRVEPSGRLLVSGHADSTCMLYDIRAAKTIQAFRPHQDEIRSVAFSSRAYYLLTGGYDGRVVLTDLQSDLTRPLPSACVAQSGDKIVQSCWHPSDFTFVTTCADKSATLWAPCFNQLYR